MVNVARQATPGCTCHQRGCAELCVPLCCCQTTTTNPSGGLGGVQPPTRIVAYRPPTCSPAPHHWWSTPSVRTRRLPLLLTSGEPPSAALPTTRPAPPACPRHNIVHRHAPCNAYHPYSARRLLPPHHGPLWPGPQPSPNSHLNSPLPPPGIFPSHCRLCSPPPLPVGPPGRPVPPV